jgi:hypothetical protein
LSFPLSENSDIRRNLSLRYFFVFIFICFCLSFVVLGIFFLDRTQYLRCSLVVCFTVLIVFGSRILEWRWKGKYIRICGFVLLVRLVKRRSWKWREWLRLLDNWFAFGNLNRCGNVVLIKKLITEWSDR